MGNNDLLNAAIKDYLEASKLAIEASDLYLETPWWRFCAKNRAWVNRNAQWKHYYNCLNALQPLFEARYGVKL